MALVPRGNFFLPAGSNLLTAFNEASRGWNEHGGFETPGPPEPVRTPPSSRARNRGRRYKRKKMQPDSSEEKTSSSSAKSGSGDTSLVGTDRITSCQIGLPYTEILSYPKPQGYQAAGIGTTSMGYGTRVSPHIYMKGMKICRTFWRNAQSTGHALGGHIMINYCLIQMNKDRSISEASEDVAQIYKIYDKFFRAYNETDETYRKFEDTESGPFSEADYNHHKLCAPINPNNGMFKLLMRKRFMLKLPTANSQATSAGQFRNGSVEFKKYKPLRHRVTWEDNDNSTIPERPIYELWWAYTVNPGQHATLTGVSHYRTIATNTMYYKNILHA